MSHCVQFVSPSNHVTSRNPLFAVCAYVPAMYIYIYTQSPPAVESLIVLLLNDSATCLIVTPFNIVVASSPSPYTIIVVAAVSSRKIIRSVGREKKNNNRLYTGGGGVSPRPFIICFVRISVKNHAQTIDSRYSGKFEFRLHVWIQTEMFSRYLL